MNSLTLGVASLFLPEQLGKAINFYGANKSRVNGYVSEEKRLFKVVHTECCHPHALRNTVAGLKQPVTDLILRELGTRNATTVAMDDFVKNSEEAIKAHASEEPTKTDITDFMARLRPFIVNVKLFYETQLPFGHWARL